MSISPAVSAQISRLQAPRREAAESRSAPDRDGDSDDIAAAPPRSATSAGVGQALDMFA